MSSAGPDATHGRRTRPTQKDTWSAQSTREPWVLSRLLPGRTEQQPSPACSGDCAQRSVLRGLSRGADLRPPPFVRLTRPFTRQRYPGIPSLSRPARCPEPPAPRRVRTYRYVSRLSHGAASFGARIMVSGNVGSTRRAAHEGTFSGTVGDGGGTALVAQSARCWRPARPTVGEWSVTRRGCRRSEWIGCANGMRTPQQSCTDEATSSGTTSNCGCASFLRVRTDTKCLISSAAVSPAHCASVIVSSTWVVAPGPKRCSRRVPHTTSVAVDINPLAVEASAANAARNGRRPRVRCSVSDMSRLLLPGLSLSYLRCMFNLAGGRRVLDGHWRHGTGHATWSHYC